MKDSLPNRMASELEKILETASQANAHGEALWRYVAYNMIKEESAPIPDPMQQNIEIKYETSFQVGAFILEALDPLLGSKDFVDRLRRTRRELKDQPSRIRKINLDECHYILSQLSFKEKARFLAMFRRKGLEETIRHWENKIRGRITLGVVIDDRFRYH